MFQVRFHGRGGHGVVTAAGWKVPVDAAPTGKRVLVVGAGPSGLSAACHLARPGHSVTIKLTEAADGHGWAGGGFDAVFVAVGAHIGKRAYMPVGDSVPEET